MISTNVASPISLSVPYRGIEPFRYVDAPIFFAREREVRDLLRHVAVYRAVLLYGDSGVGKSSLINAGLVPLAYEEGFQPERVRVQPRRGEEIVVERISIGSEGGPPYLPSMFCTDADSDGSGEPSGRLVLSLETFRKKLYALILPDSSHNRNGDSRHLPIPERGDVEQVRRPVLIFDQFEELVTMFEEAPAVVDLEEIQETQAEIFNVLIEIACHHQLPVKILFAFREDYLAKLNMLFRAIPELGNQYLRLRPPPSDELHRIIRGPFERYPGHFSPELPEAVAEAMATQFLERSGAQGVVLSELQIACLRLWQAKRPLELFQDRGLVGLLEDYLKEALARFPTRLQDPALGLLARMVTPAGTRNVIAAHDLLSRAAEDGIPRDILEDALKSLERDARLIRREHRREADYYEIVSEFLVPWISRESAQRNARLEHERERRRARSAVLAHIRRGLTVAGLAAIVLLTGLTVYGWPQREGLMASKSRELAARSVSLLTTAPEQSLLLAIEATTESVTTQALDALRRSLLGFHMRSSLVGHARPLSYVAFSPDGRLLVTTSLDGTGRIWTTDTGEPLAELRGHTGTVNSAAFSPDSRLVATAGDDSAVRIWAAANGDEMAELVGHTDSIGMIAFSPTGDVVATGSMDGTARLWNVRTGAQTFELAGHQDPVTWVAFGPDGRLMVTAGEDGTARVWVVESGALLVELRVPSDAGSMDEGATDGMNMASFSPDGRIVITAGMDSMARLWSVDTGAQNFELRGHQGPVAAAAFSPDGRMVVTAGEDGSARIWGLDTGRETVALWGHNGPVAGAAFSPDGRLVVTAGDDGTARIWMADTGTIVTVLHGHTGRVNGAMFGPDSRRVVTAGTDRIARIWEADTGNLVTELRGHTAQVNTAMFSPNGQLAVTASADETTRVWDIETRHVISDLRGHAAPVWSAAFSPDGRHVVTASADKTTQVYACETCGPADELLSLAQSRVRRALSEQERQRFIVAAKPN